jgi:glycosyltransferase involved in cell wall biosynthesis
MIDQAIRRSDIVLTDSEFSKKEIIKYTGCLDNKIFIVYNAVNLNVFRKIEDIKLLKKVKNIYKLPEKFILFVGNVKPHKNLKGLLLAYKKLNSFDFKLVIVGKKEGFITGDNELSKLINTSDLLKKNVIFTGYVKDDDLPFIYNLASIFVFPSLYEGFGIPPLEAMACGCPCVVSNAASLPEVCGDSAYYVNPYDVEDIARGIETVLNDEKLRNDLIKKGFENIKRFSWEESAKKIIQIMREIKNRG